MIRNISIFDLDGTVIDSSHRQATKPDGTLNLEHWFENATPDKIAQDRILPCFSRCFWQMSINAQLLADLLQQLLCHYASAANGCTCRRQLRAGAG